MSAADTPENAVRVLHVGKYFPPDPGGMEVYLRDLMVCSSKMGIASAALVHCSRLGLRSTDERHSAGEETFSVTRVATWFRFLFTPISPVFPLALHRLIKQHRPSLLHLHLPNPSAFWALLLPSARRVPWVVHWQSDVLTPISSRLLRLCYIAYKPFESALLKRARRIIATSPQYLSSSRPLAPFRDRCRIIPLGIADRFSDAREDSHDTTTRESLRDTATQEPLKVLAIGRLAHYKGFDVLIRAIAETLDAELDIVGSGAQLGALQSLAQSLDLGGRVLFHGAIDDTARDALLLRCDCLCLPSIDRTESFGIALLEAMSAGKACVVADVPGSGMTAVVDAKRTGLVVPVDDPIALAAAFQILDRDRTLLTAMGKCGREKYKSQLTIEASTTRVVSLYDDL
jgi:glycosyltransferase involved in cell wall biosynthesis